MNINDPTIGKVLLHGKGAGGVTPADIERRARELADIDGRSGGEITKTDLAQARAELIGTLLPATSSDDAEANVGLSRDPSEPPSATRHEVPSLEAPDEGKEAERLTLEGVDEAQHDQMIAARRRARKEDRRGNV
jgi:hypothetical protein